MDGQRLLNDMTMTPRRFLYVARTATGGSAFSLYHLVKGLDRTRYEPIVLFYCQGRSDIGNKLAELGIRVISLERRHREPCPVPPSSVRRRDVRGWLEARFGGGVGQAYVFLKAWCEFVRREALQVWPIVRAIRENGIDLVHVNTGLRHGKPGIIAAWITRRPCICHVRMFHQLNHFDRLFTRLVSGFIYISRAIAEDCTAQGIPPAKGRVIHNAVDLSEFPAVGDAVGVRREFGWSADQHLVGVVGRLDWWKGHEYFLGAMAEVVQRFSDVKGLIIGEPGSLPQNLEYCQRLKSLTKSLGLEDKVVFTGFRGDVPRLMSALDVIVLSSSVPEPFGRVVIEGMAAGKPVVATAAGGVLDVIDDGVNGLLVPPGDSQAIARAILRLLSNPEEAGRIGAAARQCVERRFTVQRHVIAMQRIYSSILDAPLGHSPPLGMAGYDIE